MILLFIGKSDLARRLVSVVGDKNDTDKMFFERLLTKFTNPEELFGPLSLTALERDEYVRNVQGYLPAVSIAFLDEIFKANSAILNSLLTILNERKFDNGNCRLDVPLKALVAASNELPDSEELDALYDRFLLRRKVQPVSDELIMTLLENVGTSNRIADTTTNDIENLIKDQQPLLTSEHIVSLQKVAFSNVTISREALLVLKDVRTYLRDELEPSVYCSDRRLVCNLIYVQYMH